MLVGLYTSRVMLQALGINDYGINNVVGGIVAMSSLVTSTMGQAISRYITFIIGQGNEKHLKMMFSTSVNAEILLSVLAIVLLEVFGLWFLNTSAKIPEGRMIAAHWVFQCSLVSLVIGLISAPYNALLIAHERMSIYAYTSIAEVSLKLIVVFLIVAYDGDRLILYALLTVLVSLIIRVFYGWYCGRNFKEANYNPSHFDKRLLKELSVFSGWNLLNNGAWLFATQGVNILVNMFFGVVYNTARGIAQTVDGAVQVFVGNFTIAYTPQITKSYAVGDKEYAIHLANRGTKFTWLMTYIFIVPVCCEAELLLRLWLGQVPEWSVLFLRLAMFESLAVTSGKNLFRLIQADGNIKKFNIHTSIMMGIIFPLVWISFRLGLPVWIAYLIFILDFLLLNLVLFYDLKKLMPFSIRQFLREVFLPCIIVSVSSFLLPLIVCYYMKSGYLRFFVNIPTAVFWTCICCILFGLTNSERYFLWNRIKIFFEKIKNTFSHNL